MTAVSDKVGKTLKTVKEMKLHIIPSCRKQRHPTIIFSSWKAVGVISKEELLNAFEAKKKLCFLTKICDKVKTEGNKYPGILHDISTRQAELLN